MASSESLRSCFAQHMSRKKSDAAPAPPAPHAHKLEEDHGHYSSIEEARIVLYYRWSSRMRKKHTVEYEKLLDRQARELAKLNEHIEEVAAGLPAAYGPPHAKDAIKTCARSSLEDRVIIARKKAEMLLKQLVKGIPQRRGSTTTDKAAKKHTDCGVCWDCQRAALLREHEGQKEQVKAQYFTEARERYKDTVKHVGGEKLTWVIPYLDVDTTATAKVQSGLGSTEDKGVSLWKKLSVRSTSPRRTQT
jgi:hypothetical protein